jgi:hypothetical protein
VELDEEGTMEEEEEAIEFSKALHASKTALIQRITKHF